MRIKPKAGRCLTNGYSDFSLPTGPDIKPLVANLVLIVKVGIEDTSEYDCTLFVLMKTFAALGDVKNTKVSTKKYNAPWLLATTGKTAPEERVELAFGLVGRARAIQKTNEGGTKATDIEAYRASEVLGTG